MRRLAHDALGVIGSNDEVVRHAHDQIVDLLLGGGTGINRARVHTGRGSERHHESSDTALLIPRDRQTSRDRVRWGAHKKHA